MTSAFYYTVSLELDKNDEDLDKVITESRELFNSSGYEEFSLSEQEVDEILGDEAFCGGDLSDELMEKLEASAKKSIKFYFNGDEAEANSLNFENYLKEMKIGLVLHERCEEQDWNENWKQHYSPIVLDNIVVIPVWEKDKDEYKDKMRIIINPGMGFGTGTHETTRQCLMLLQDLIEKGEKPDSCLDFGSGSGILGIAYQKYFQGPTDYVDIDQRALENNEENFKLNFNNINPKARYLLRKDYQVSQQYDLVFANILEHVLLEEKDLIASASSKTLIVSGLLNEQRDSVVEAYSDCFDLVSERSEGDWLAISFIKK